MTDAFSELGLPKRPGLAQSEIKNSFLERAKSLHPDSQTGDAEKFESLRAAYDLLKDPATRLRHLITLETGQSPKNSPPTGHFELFSAVCQIVEQTRTAIPEATRASNALARSLMAIQLDKLIKSATEITSGLDVMEQNLNSRLADLEPSWPQHEAAAALASDFAFTAKCRKQLAECLFELNDSMRALRQGNA